MIESIKRQKILPILRGVPEEEAYFLVECLLETDISILEISVNQPGSFDLINGLNQKFGRDLTVGAGTVVDTPIAYKAADYGAAFFLSPSFSADVANTSRRLNIPYIPGAYSPTEIQQAYEAGADLIKVFPVRQVGPGYIKDVLASLNHVNLMAVGGVGLDNVNSWFEAGVQAVGIGSSLFPKDWVQKNEKSLIVQRLKEFQLESLKKKGE
ncbi:bifunctional 4-hydroxy-2-oxoglutarate aldolase/2-dehydro-3-deoxy-phosphogluconate aldolase [Virgibacillus sp. YIM 98842]|uniref:bifunctional 4-hydroxy-2-oxoglutarate aldolase/2-dehydro-3-deoxy-phosphogluconate aldolase n=1 Tax=Virgibacillus sp. YIM 98842 TaxID=2663533 RepID=UPI0013DD03FD|nr:bifunctional 4-hydroxy-2-oxoglutarate aldolase/2-dehydro-3-deoxy-phosphogluconate aldolase [Virgibacillus sp. YIM 98842]